jgi:ABC-type microcin C transport system permease subunit YejB
MDRMVAEGGTRTEGDRTGAVAGILAVGILALGISAGPAAGDILVLDILVEGILAAGTLVAAVLLALVAVALFRAGSVLHIEGTAGLTVEEPDRFIHGNL